MRGTKGNCIAGSVRGKICPCHHSRRQSKIFASSVNFSRNNAIYNINESTSTFYPDFISNTVDIPLISSLITKNAQIIDI